jgi:hypothetical protein
MTAAARKPPHFAQGGGRLGDRLAAFVRMLRRGLLADNPAGRWEQESVTEVLVALRPAR